MPFNAFKILPACKAICLILLISVSTIQSKDDDNKKELKEQRKTARLPPCAACNAFVKSFEAGMKRTSRGKLEGGDTAWEEKNQVFGLIKCMNQVIQYFIYFILIIYSYYSISALKNRCATKIITCLLCISFVHTPLLHIKKPLPWHINKIYSIVTSA